MVKIKSFSDLKVRREAIKSGNGNNGANAGSDNHIEIKIAMATCGIAAGARVILDFFVEQLDRRNIDGVVTQTGCMGYCFAEPTIEVRLPGQDPVVFGGVTIKKADEIIEKYIKTGELVDGIIPVNYETIYSKEYKEE